MIELPEKPDLSQINYVLPEKRIAKYPLANRSDSKLLVYQNGNIIHRVFKELDQIIDSGASLFFNNTKVIPARLFFRKDTGAYIEIFLLKPISPSNIMSIAMEERASVTWQCMVGNLKKWKDEHPLYLHLRDGTKNIEISAKLKDRDSKLVEFAWDNPEYSFAEIVELTGKVPLPPYLKREAEEEDKDRYQTVYSKEEGAVAAPTAGLHFTDEVLYRLKENGVNKTELTLHVSAGTFQPIKSKDAREHPMHSEQMEVNLEAIESVIDSNQIIAVGTTSMRTLESLYWYGVRLMNGDENFTIEKLELYHKDKNLPSRTNSFKAIAKWMKEKGLKKIHGTTEIFIMPGYEFKVCDGIITNFHQPDSTLLLLISAFIGNDWKRVYQEALAKEYRFLSYGDSSILLP